jgi:threonine/homoserine/homoserine lactone efflux protein
MLIAFIIGLIIGFLICIPVGPINMWAVNTQLRRDFKSAISIALGASTMDFVYFMIILSGLSLFHFSPLVIHTLKIIGVIILFVFGAKELLTSSVSFQLTEEEKKKTPNPSSYFLLGVIIYTSNPTLIASMTGVASVIKSWNLFETNIVNHFFLSLGLALGTLSWFFLLLKTVSRYQHKIPEIFYVRFSKACGIFILIFSLYMAFNVYKEVMI